VLFYPQFFQNKGCHTALLINLQRKTQRLLLVILPKIFVGSIIGSINNRIRQAVLSYSSASTVTDAYAAHCNIFGIDYADCLHSLFFAGNADYGAIKCIVYLLTLFIYFLLLDGTQALLGLLLVKLLSECGIAKSKIVLRQLIPIAGNSIGRIDKAVNTSQSPLWRITRSSE